MEHNVENMQTMNNLEERLDIVKTANDMIEHSREFWVTRKPLKVRNIGVLRNNLNVMADDLKTLKELRLRMFSTSIDERIKSQVNQYYESVAIIPKNLLDKVNRLEINRFRNRTNQAVFLTEYAHPPFAIDDQGTSIKMAEMVREGKYTVSELNEMSKNDSLKMHEYLHRGKKIPDKSAPEVANLVWSVLNVIEPIIEIDDENVLYQRIALGHPKGWSEVYKRRHDGIRYLNSVKRRYTMKMGRHKVHFERLDNGEWFVDSCFPELLSIESGPWLLQLLLYKSAEESRLNRDKQSYIS